MNAHRAMAVCLAFTVALGAGTAAAAPRFADPDGVGAPPCAEAAPCDLPTALTGATDEVILLPGTHSYNTGATFLNVPNGITVRGATGQARPVLAGGNSFGVFDVRVGATIRDLDLTGTGGPGVFLEGGVMDRVISRTAIAGQNGCVVAGPTTVTNSVCVASGANTSGAGFSGTGYTFTATLRNDTMLATGANTRGISFTDAGAGVPNTLTVNATNVIASGGTKDVFADGSTLAQVNINLDHSDYASEQEQGTAAVTNPGSGTNITDAPSLDATFHQTSGSRTIDAGVTDPLNGPSDLDGTARAQGASTDIGADEFPPAPQAPASAVAAPPDPGPTPPPPGPPTFGPSTLVTLALPSSKSNSSVRLLVANGNPFAVRGSLALATAGPVASANKPVSLGTKSFTTAAKGTTILTFRLGSKVRKALGRKGSLKLRATAVLTDPAGARRTVTGSLTARAKKRR